MQTPGPFATTSRSARQNVHTYMRSLPFVRCCDRSAHRLSPRHPATDLECGGKAAALARPLVPHQNTSQSGDSVAALQTRR